MNVKEKAVKILKDSYVCDRCLGRSYAQLLTGTTNEERGKILRHYLAMLIDSGEELDVDSSNFYGIKFHLKKIKTKKPKKCSICGNLFKKLKKKVKLILKKLKKYEFETFLVGCRLPPKLLKKQEALWNKVGIEWCESIKNEINRFIGKQIERKTSKTMDRELPDITILVDLDTDSIELDVRSVYVYGKYQKLVRGIPQTKWEKKVYPTSVQEEIEKPFLKESKAEKSTMHGAGREDADARCLGWRPFVLELVNPVKRKLDLKKIGEEVNESEKVNVDDLKIVDKKVIRKIKSARYDKTYKAIVEFKDPVEDLERLDELKDSVITQKTPTRVLTRRSDRVRKRKVKDIKHKVLSKNKVELKITGQSGLYVKELITGDEGRTEPNISDLLDNEVKEIKLDVVEVHCD